MKRAFISVCVRLTSLLNYDTITLTEQLRYCNHMNDQELSEYVKTLGIARDHILREEVEMRFLEILSQNKLSKKVLFYGGTALRLAYGSPRFSEDIDLLCLQKVSFAEFEKFLLGVVETESSRWTLRDIKNKRNTLFALIGVTDERLKHSFSVKIELHKELSVPPLEMELLLIKSQVSTSEPLLLVPKLEELKQLKAAALVSRKKARDIFDLWYIAQASRSEFVTPDILPSYGKREFTNELRVFLPRKYHPVIPQLYEHTLAKH